MLRFFIHVIKTFVENIYVLFYFANNLFDNKLILFKDF